MKFLLKFFSFVSIVLFSQISVYAGNFIDVDEDNLHYDAINYLENENVIHGYDDGTFKPYNAINRAEFTKILIGHLFPDFEESANCFSDVKVDWYAPYICYAKKNGIVDGYSDGTFLPANEINLAEALKIVLESYEPNKDFSSDIWYEAYLAYAIDQNLLFGIDPFLNHKLLRAEMAQLIYNLEVDIPSSETLNIWANEGGDKVTQDELRASLNENSVINSVWDGDKVNIFGAKNEVVNFNLILESPNTSTDNLNIEFDLLTGPNGDTISSTQTTDLFDWTNRNIELFYVRYLEIKGLSSFIGESYDQRHLPEKMRTTYDPENGIPTGDWYDRPNHNAFYPEIAVPLSLEENFKIEADENQSIWVDIYIPKNISAGIYSGELKVEQNDDVIQIVPVVLEVYNFVLPDEPVSKTMLVLGDGDINLRYLGEKWPDDEKALQKIEKIRNEHFKLAHRHKISLIDSETAPGLDQPSGQWISRLDGSLFTSANGYDGPGVSVSNNVYSIGTYGSWGWQGEGEESMQTHADNWEGWFKNNFPNIERFLYLIDESSDYEQIEEWANWIENSDGIGKNLLSMATTWLVNAYSEMPSLDIPASSMYVAATDETQEVSDYYNSQSDKKVFFYNGGRPGQGSFMIEDDGIALRELAWGQYKKNIDRWFYWESTYYNNFQAGLGETDVFNQAQTFGGNSGFDEFKGETGWNYSNGDGVLFYPGTDMIFPEESYDLDGPMASLRLKYWRRGIQDVDYLYLAMQKDPEKTWAIINDIVPKVLWEYGVSDPDDPTWVRTEISWSDDVDVWEEARKELAEIIDE